MKKFIVLTFVIAMSVASGWAAWNGYFDFILKDDKVEAAAQTQPSEELIPSINTPAEAQQEVQKDMVKEIATLSETKDRLSAELETKEMEVINLKFQVGKADPRKFQPLYDHVPTNIEKSAVSFIDIQNGKYYESGVEITPDIIDMKVSTSEFIVITNFTINGESNLDSLWTLRLMALNHIVPCKIIMVSEPPAKEATAQTATPTIETIPSTQ